TRLDYVARLSREYDAMLQRQTYHLAEQPRRNWNRWAQPRGLRWPKYRLPEQESALEGFLGEQQKLVPYTVPLKNKNNIVQSIVLCRMQYCTATPFFSYHLNCT